MGVTLVSHLSWYDIFSLVLVCCGKIPGLFSISISYLYLRCVSRNLPLAYWIPVVPYYMYHTLVDISCRASILNNTSETKMISFLNCCLLLSVTLGDRRVYRSPLPSPVVWSSQLQVLMRGWMPPLLMCKDTPSTKVPQLVVVEAAPAIPSLLMCFSWEPDQRFFLTSFFYVHE